MALLSLLVAAAALGSALFLWLAATFARGLRSSAVSRSGAKKPLRVGFVHPDFGIGGAENLVVNAMLALQRQGARVTMFTAHHDVTHCFEETRGDGPLAHSVRVHGDWLPRSIAGRLFALCASLRVLFVTLVIAAKYVGEVDAFFVDQVSVCVPFLRALGKPVLFYGHFPDKLLSRKGSTLKAIYRAPLDLLEEVTTASADVVVANSNFSRKVFQASFPRVGRREIGVLYPPVDVTTFQQFSASKPRDPNLFVSLNRFERKKDVALAIQALAVVQRRISASEFADVKLIVAGGYDPNNTENHEHLRELQQIVKDQGLEQHVEFRTSVSDAMKKELLATAQAVMYTPSNEHFGIVPVEAMTYGTPVIAVNSGGPLESVAHGETGFLCESDASAFADAMLQLLGPDGHERAVGMGKAGKARARAIFSLEAFSDALLKLVEQML